MATTEDFRVTYTVDAEFTPGNWVNVYSGHNQLRATQSSIFWDARVPVRESNDTPPEGALALALWKFDRLIKEIQNA